MKKVFIVHVNKKSTFDMAEFTGCNHFVGTNIDVLKKAVKEYYGKKGEPLLKNEEDEFPYFTDGGFKYTMQTKYWNYTFTCYDIDFIEH